MRPGLVPHVRGGRRRGTWRLYVAAMGGSHPLAKKIGTWPSVLAVTATTAGASELVTRLGRRHPADAV